jgi:hypothetical protein
MNAKDLRQLMRQYRRLGWTITATGSGHLLWRSPSGERVITASTPGDYHTFANTKSRLRRTSALMEMTK